MQVLGSLGSMQNYLNPEIVQSPHSIQLISEALIAGRLVCIKNAFKQAFAEKIFNCLDRFSQWKIYEDYKEHFHYRHHNIYDEDLFPPDLRWCKGVFENEPTKRFVAELSHRECSGKVQFSASWYLPGDHSLPHNDLVLHANDEWRQVAFIWHLTQNWQAGWGGDLFWCPTNRYLAPTFNALLLFVVRKESMHFVTTVSPYAQSKRLAINGWWTGKNNSPESKDPGRPETSQPSLIEVI